MQLLSSSTLFTTDVRIYQFELNMIVDPKTNQPRKKLVVRAPNSKLLAEWKRSINYVITQARDRMLEARKGGKPAALPMSRSAGAMAGHPGARSNFAGTAHGPERSLLGASRRAQDVTSTRS